MKINGFTFEHLTKEDLGVNVEEVVNTNLYKLIRSCIENENILFYNKNDKSYGICDLNTFEKYIKADYIICYNNELITHLISLSQHISLLDYQLYHLY